MFTETIPVAGEPPSAFALDYGSADARRFVPNRDELSRVLGCSRSTVAAMLNEPGNPGRTQNESYDIEKWRAYFAERKKRKADEPLGLDGGTPGEKAELRAAVLRERRAKAEKAELEAAKLRGELVEVAVAQNAAFEFANRLKAAHARAATVEAVNELSTLLELNSDQTARLLVYMEKFHDRFCAKIAETENES